jgi:hypothetical protein
VRCPLRQRRRKGNHLSLCDLAHARPAYPSAWRAFRCRQPIRCANATAKTIVGDSNKDFRSLGMEMERRLGRNALRTMKQQRRDTRHPLPPFVSVTVSVPERGTHPFLLDRSSNQSTILRIRRRMSANAAVISARDIPCKRRLCLRRTTTLSASKSPRPLSVRKTST